jgi:hypothetical protein
LDSDSLLVSDIFSAARFDIFDDRRVFSRYVFRSKFREHFASLCEMFASRKVWDAKYRACGCCQTGQSLTKRCRRLIKSALIWQVLKVARMGIA